MLKKISPVFDKLAWFSWMVSMLEEIQLILKGNGYLDREYFDGKTSDKKGRIPG
jgi:hypothetical protein